MDLYTIFKFLHVMTAICWAGGGFTMLFLGVMAARQKDDAAMADTINTMAGLGATWFVPASMLTLVFGLGTAFFGNLWGDLWVILGLAGFAGSFCIGMFLIKPRGDQAAELMAQGRAAEALAIGRQILQVSKFDYTLMFVIIADMVFKPYLGDFVVLLVMAALLAAGGALFLAPLFRKSAASAAA